jgi:hypothetical protein
MKLKIIKTARWTKVGFTTILHEAGKVLSVPEDVPLKQANDMLQNGYAVLLEGELSEANDAQRDLSSQNVDVKANAPENKAITPQENKTPSSSPADVKLDDMTRKELLHYARSKSLVVDEKASKLELIKQIKQGGKSDV